MKLYLEYDHFLNYQPIWWQNFIKEVDIQFNLKPSLLTNNRDVIIANEIKLAGAVKIRDDKNQEEYLEFEDPHKATWFLLKYS